MEATEYAFRKVVRNNAIVREVDEVRQREMWQWASILVVFVIVVLGSVWLQIDSVKRGYAITALQNQRLVEEETNRKLRLKIETLREPNRIQSLAIHRLHMVEAAPDQAIIIERVVPSPRPAASVVAAAH